MTPGNRDPGRYSKTTLTAAVAALIAAGASTPVIYQQFLAEREGTRMAAYLDSANIWTICQGLTRIYGRPVAKGDRLTRDECARLDAEEQARGLAEMQKLLAYKVSAPALAGIASFCWHNIGPTKCKNSTFLRLFNQGPAYRNEACAQITLWIRDAGRDCRVRANGCFGQVDRRQQEDELCLIRDGEGLQ